MIGSHDISVIGILFCSSKNKSYRVWGLFVFVRSGAFMNPEHLWLNPFPLDSGASNSTALPIGLTRL